MSGINVGTILFYQGTPIGRVTRVWLDAQGRENCDLAVDGNLSLQATLDDYVTARLANMSRSATMIVTPIDHDIDPDAGICPDCGDELAVITTAECGTATYCPTCNREAQP